MDGKLPAQITDLLTRSQPADDGLLLRELQHRHANDVAIIVAAVRICARRIGKHSRHAAMLMGLAETLQAIGEVNAILAAPGAEDVEDLAPALEMLVDAANRRSPDNVRILVSAQSVDVRGFVCRRLALAVNELILNAVKHGHQDGRIAEVTVALRDDGKGMVIAVENDAPFKRWSRTGSQGTAIVSEIVNQLGGEVARRRTVNGVQTLLIFPSLAVRASDEPF